MGRRGLLVVVIVAIGVANAGLAAYLLTRPGDGEDTAAGAETTTTSPPTTAVPTTTTAPPYEGWVDPASVGLPWGDAVPGLLTFRGNPTRTYYGQGPLPVAPQPLWSFPAEGSMCGTSRVGGETSTWCGTGWTGQPAVFERDGLTWVAFGAYDYNVHWLDAATGQRTRADFPTGDIIKGSVTIDPDGFPLLYSGSRDNRFRVIAFDRDPPEELWALDARDVSPTRWNDDWDGSGLVLSDFLFVGGENSNIHIARLNRSYDAEGMVTVSPELVFNAPGWDDELLGAVPDGNVSIEGSVAISGNTLYFANSGGLVQGWDITGVALGVEPTRVFRFWTGDDTDASVVVDEAGMLYVGSEYERSTARADEVGQIMKLDPSIPDQPLVWSVPVRDHLPDGVWGTPALHRDVLYVPTDSGSLLAIDRATGAVRWTKPLPGPLWQSPVVVDDVLIQGDCNGVLHAFDVRDTTIDPPEIWAVELGGCIESTPAVWNGRIYVGTRAGQVWAVGDPG